MLSKHIQNIITPDQTPKNNEFIHAIQVLTQKVGYYHLSGYSYSLRKLAGKNSFPRKGNSARAKRFDEFVPNATMEHVITFYEFDEDLRQVVWQAISQLEVGLRVSIGYIFGRYDPYLHLNVNKFWEENQANSAGKKQQKARKFSKTLSELQKSPRKIS